MESMAKEVKLEMSGLIRVYKDGTFERLWSAPHVPSSLEDPGTGVASKDVIVSTATGLSARLYLPKLTEDTIQKKLPILVHFHGGGFCSESPFSPLTHRYMSILASQAEVIVVSPEYRLVPEHPLPAAYEDCWTALNWVASLPDPWLANHGDLEMVYIGGDSAGANITHNIAMRAGTEGLEHGVKLLGAFLSHPFFLESPPIGELGALLAEFWDYLYPNVPGGSDSPMISPMGAEAPSLAGLGCSTMLVVVAGEDLVRGAGVGYYEAIKDSGYQGRVELFEVKGEGHAFHIHGPDSNNAKLVFERLASFLGK